MLAPKSTHKRKRSSTRTDKARKLGPARWIVNLIPSSSSSTSNSISAPYNVAGPSRLHKLVDAHPFNSSLELILPLSLTGSDATSDSSTPLPTSVQSLIQKLRNLASSHKSYRARIPLSLLLDPIFVTAYLKTGSLVALSHPSGGAPGLSPDLQDTVCIDGQGTLVLSLCKDTYQTLGLTGRASHFSRLASGRAADRTSGPDSRFIVELPLLSPSFIPGKKGYQQALDRLRAWDRSRAAAFETEHTIAQTHASSKIWASSQAHLPLTYEHATWDMLFVWSPNRANAEAIAASGFSSSFVNEIQFPEHLVRPQDVETLALHTIDPVVTDSIWIPTLNDPAQHPLANTWSENRRHFTELEPVKDSTTLTWSTFQDGLQEAIEWAGLASLGANSVRTYARPDATCVYSPPSPSKPGRTVKLKWAGSAGKPLLLSPLFISHIAAEVDRFVAESNQIPSKKSSEKAQWATLSCSGFPHAPLTWRAKVPFSSVYGAKELPSTKPQSQKKASQDVHMTDASSSASSDDDDESDSSLDMGDIRKRKTKKRSKRNIGKNQTEHTFTPSTGETGWVSFCLGSPAPPKRVGERPSRWVLVELVGTDTRS
ncbi:uncharacterized protein UTRI_06172_B [Ustilago trichophora]|uniref:Uncharacterized protein n=1 Tax=Ustilago trichophora TaxID=86804 RepID=A0A5C3EIK5_9BASI|nr:uncharacterized protein UTRI_06172_B [Ustilago trichophora]